MMEGPPTMESKSEEQTQDTGTTVEVSQSVGETESSNLGGVESEPITLDSLETVTLSSANEDAETGKGSLVSEKTLGVENNVETKLESSETITGNISKESTVINIDAEKSSEKTKEQLDSVRKELENVEVPEKHTEMFVTHVVPEITLYDSEKVHTAETNIKRKPCEKCRGSGRRFIFFTCRVCGGSGSVTSSVSHKINTFSTAIPTDGMIYDEGNPSAQALRPETAGIERPSSIERPANENAEKTLVENSETITANTYEGTSPQVTVNPSETRTSQTSSATSGNSSEAGPR